MKYTGNYNLKKPEGTDAVNVQDFNDNADILDFELSNKANAVFQTAGGTATAITLTGITLLDGFSITFVVKSNNNGAATTVNGKSLYKPKTTAAPNLVAGKAVTIWFDATSSRFFIKASAEGDAAAGNVLAGKIFSNDDDTGITGTMSNRGAVSQTLNAGGSYTIPAGYHNGSGKVTGNSLASQTAATATAARILSGYTAWINGSQITGTMPSKAAQTYTPTTTNQSIGSGQYLSGNQTIRGDGNLVSANIRAGVSIFGVSGNGYVVNTQDAVLYPEHLLVGDTGYDDGVKKAGTMPNRGAWTATRTSNGNTAIPAGYHNGSGYVATNTPVRYAATGQGTKVAYGDGSFRIRCTTGFRPLICMAKGGAYMCGVDWDNIGWTAGAPAGGGSNNFAVKTGTYVDLFPFNNGEAPNQTYYFWAFA